MPFSINIPSELCISLLCLVLITQIKISDSDFIKFIKHPISLSVSLLLFWHLLSTVFSEYRLVSIKYTAVSVAHYLCFFLGFYFLENKFKTSIEAMIKWYFIGLFPVLIYSWLHHAAFDFAIHATPIIPQPFFNDHALYSACLAMILPMIHLLRFNTRYEKHLKVAFSILILSSIIFMFCRAAWLSLLLAGILILVTTMIKNSFKIIFIPIVALFLLSLYFIPNWILNHAGGKQERTKNSLSYFMTSIVNTETDVSNMERINRYSCAIRMYKDHPVLGFGPGSFQFAYVPYQQKNQMTRISITPDISDVVYQPTGRGGGAHSEIFQLLAEEGMPALILWGVLIWVVIYKSMKNYWLNSKQKWVVLSVCFALVTFFVHGMLNNFLHMEELSVLFYSMMAKMVLAENEKSD